MNVTEPKWNRRMPATSAEPRRSSRSPTMKSWPTRWSSVIEANTRCWHERAAVGISDGLGAGDTLGPAVDEEENDGGGGGWAALQEDKAMTASRQNTRRRIRGIGRG